MQGRPQPICWTTAEQAVIEWPGLRGEPRLAWLRMWREALAGQPGTIVVTCAGVGAWLGSNDRAGRRALEALGMAGLIDRVDAHRGRWTVDVLDPLDVQRARRARVSDGQGELFDQDDREPTDELQSTTAVIQLAQSAVADTLTNGGSGTTSAVCQPRGELDLELKSARASELELRIKCLEESADSKKALQLQEVQIQSAGVTNGGSGTTSAAGAGRTRGLSVLPHQPVETVASAAEPLAFGAIIASLPVESDRQARADKLALWIQREVDDPCLQAAPCYRVAWAVIDGDLPEAELGRIIRFVKTHGAVHRWQSFVGCAKRKFADLRLPWHKPK